MTKLTEYLLEARLRLIYFISVFTLCFIFCYYNIQHIIDYLILPFLQNHNFALVSNTILESFLLKIRISIYSTILICFPWLITQIWLGIRNALYAAEKSNIIIIIIFACLLFYIGLLFGFYIITPVAIRFLQQQQIEQINNLTNISSYLDFIFKLNINFAIIFQTPIIIIILNKLHIITVSQIKKFRKYAFVLAFIIGAIMAPPDVLSQFMLAIPLYILYEIGYIIIKLINIRSSAQQ